MSDIIETVTVVREEHPYGRVDININDLQKTDTVYKESTKDTKPTKDKKDKK